MKEVTIKIIYDNCKENKDLQEGWGFSAVIEKGDRKILFDTGNDQDAFFSNIEKMNIDLKGITDVLFSHKHKDHVTGCREILGRLNENCRIFLPKGFPTKLVPKNLEIKTVTGFQEMEKDVFSMVLKGGIFLHEQSLVVQTMRGLIIVTGCAHPGIINIVDCVQKKLNQPIHLVLGGFHLFRKKGSKIEKIVAKFQELQVKTVAPCHCSGKLTLEQFQAAYQQDFHKIGTGSVLTIA